LSRQKDLARMASGDMATEEAEVFAEALIQDATIKAKKARLQPEE
jgi:DNA repair ATPase RecN